MLRIVPPYCGCGWHSTTAAGGVPVAGVELGFERERRRRCAATGSRAGSRVEPDRRAHEREHRRFVAPGVVAARRAAVAGAHLGAQHDRLVRGRVRRAASRPTSPAPSTARAGSLSPVVTNIAGYGPGADVVVRASTPSCARTPSGSCGSPHSSHSVMVSGRSGSSIVVTTSTNGTSATIAAKRSGRRLATAPISRPPALPPRATSRAGVRVALGDERLGARDEVGERVRLVVEAAVLVPARARARRRRARARSRTRSRGRGATRATRGTSGRSSARTRRSPTSSAGARAVERDVAAVHDRDRHPGAVGRGRPQPRRRVRARVVAAEHRLHPHDGRRVRCAGRSRGRSPARRATCSRSGSSARRTRGSARPTCCTRDPTPGSVVTVVVVEAHHAQPVEAVGPFAQHEVVAERVDRVEPHVVAVRHHVDPVLAARVDDRRGDELEVPRAVAVGDDEEPVAELVVARGARRVYSCSCSRGATSAGALLGRVGRDEPRLRGQLRRRLDQHEPAGAGAADVDEEALVVLAEHERVVGRRRAERGGARPRWGASRRRAARRSTCARRRPTRGRT